MQRSHGRSPMHRSLLISSLLLKKILADDKQYTRLTPYNKTAPCVAGKRCSTTFCPGGQILCMHRAQFHVGLAALGKTDMTDDERALLAPGTYYAKRLERRPRRVRNPLFVYEQTTMRNESFWVDLADYLSVPSVPHDLYHSSRGVSKSWGNSSRIDVCDPRYDDFRRAFMPIAYDISEWFLGYFIPVALDPDRPDVVVADPARFRELVLDYRNDPCHRLVRNDTDGTYYNRLPANQ